MNETKSGFIEKINKVDKPLVRLIKKTKRQDRPIINIKHEIFEEMTPILYSSPKIREHVPTHFIRPILL